ncbi:MAG: type II secretion system GspH family protein [Burkholderiales bacterium]|jgi:type II secretory pathway pseudopilin PulG|nr:type II secretion system GspH family protein [Burkholderiales bacterium]
MTRPLKYHALPQGTSSAQHGFTYLTVIFILAILTGGLALIGEVWHTTSLQDKEAELLFVGNQYRKAIERYYLGGPRQFPRTVNDLLKDPRTPTTERYLRKAYADPVTGKTEWGLVKAPDGGIMGIYSLSELKPLKSANFRLQDKSFEKTEKYSDWKFIYSPLQLTIVPTPIAKPLGATQLR